MRASEQQSEGPYPLLSREWLASADRFDDPAGRELADRIIAAYAAEHPPRLNAEAVADAVDWKVTFRGLKQHGVPPDELLAQARREVAEEVGKKQGAVKSDHVRATFAVLSLNPARGIV